MDKTAGSFHFSESINLKTSPLAEAWLVLRWKLTAVPGIENTFRDELFPIALGKFVDLVKEKFPTRVELDANKAPLELLPHVVRFQMRAGSIESWPLIQIGPGIASINYQSPYKWEEFERDALYLRQNIISAYSEKMPVLDSITLNYRNAIPFNYSKQDLCIFLEKELNTKIKLPTYIPGTMADKKFPVNLILTSNYSLTTPKAIGMVRIATGSKKIVNPSTRQSEQQEQIVFDTEITSSKEDVISLSDEKAYKDWLESAHKIAHEWFFSFVEGDLLKEYSK